MDSTLEEIKKQINTMDNKKQQVKRKKKVLNQEEMKRKR